MGAPPAGTRVAASRQLFSGWRVPHKCRPQSTVLAKLLRPGDRPEQMRDGTALDAAGISARFDGSLPRQTAGPLVCNRVIGQAFAASKPRSKPVTAN